MSYKRVPYEKVEHTEIAQKSYLLFEHGKDDPDEAEIEAAWIAERKRLYRALDKLTDRQRQVFILMAAGRLKEVQVAERLGIYQSTVSQHYNAALKKLRKLMAK